MDFSIDKKGYNTEEVDEFIKKLIEGYEQAMAHQKERIFELKSALSNSEASIKSYKERSSVISKAIFNAVAKADEIEHLTNVKYNHEINRLKAFHEKWITHYNRIIEKYPLDDELLQVTKFNRQMSGILAKAKTIDDEKAKNEGIGSLEQTFGSENERVKEAQIGAIKVKVADNRNSEDILRQMLPDTDPNSPILSGDFNPLERIGRFLNDKPQDYPDEKEAKPTPTKTPTPKSNGFSFEEALNPKESLEQIMKELGVLLNDPDQT